MGGIESATLFTVPVDASVEIVIVESTLVTVIPAPPTILLLFDASATLFTAVVTYAVVAIWSLFVVDGPWGP